MGKLTLYYEAGIPATLLPVAFIGWAKTPGHDVTGQFNAVIRLKRGTKLGAYKTGEVLHVPAWSVVNKSGRRDYHQLVRAAALPPIDPANLIKARA